MHYRLLFASLAVLAVLAAGCGDWGDWGDEQHVLLPGAPAGAVDAGKYDLREGFDTDEVPVLYFGRKSIEESILGSDVVARVSVTAVTGGVESTNWTRRSDPPGIYSVVLAYTFTVHEYLKGSGGNEIVGLVVSEYEHRSESAARRYIDDRLATRDTRWDDRQAIVFMRKNPAITSTSQADRYYMGQISYDDEDGYTVASRFAREWLPDASALPLTARQTSGASSESTEQYFLLADPAATTGAADSSSDTARATSGAPTIGLTDFKSKVADLQAEVSAGDGSDEYENCVFLDYVAKRREQHHIDSGNPTSASFTITSGVANLEFFSERRGSGLPPDRIGRYWTSGPDAALFNTVTSDLSPYRLFAEADDPPDHVRYTRSSVTTRPLPAGTYTYKAHGLAVYRLPCNSVPDPDSAGWTVNITVISVVGVDHEAFFDPVAIGPGSGTVGADGTLNPTSFSLDGVSSTLTSIEWRAGTLTVDLDVPVADSQRHLDFLDLSGDLILTVAVKDASVNPDGDLAWSVGGQPWENGDLLMVRLHKATANLCTPKIGFALPGACYTQPEFPGAPYAFTVSEDAAAGDEVGTLSVTFPDDDNAKTLSITSGDDDNRFALADNGALTVAGKLNYETASSYTLTVRADAGRWQRSETTVTVTVADVSPEFAPVPDNFAAVAVDGGFDLSWDAVEGAGRYAVQYRPHDGSYTAQSEFFTYETSHDLRFTVRCGTAYFFRWFSEGDGVLYDRIIGEVPVELEAVSAPCEDGG